MFLNKIRLLKEKRKKGYPFSIPVVQSLTELELTHPVTYFVGENGSGKSKLLEAIADVCGFNTAGGGRNNQYEVDAAGSDLSDSLRLSWMPKVTNGFFLRAESFYQFASHVDQMGSYDAYGGTSLHYLSHGESFMSLFLNRFGGRALYLLDEPEAALSPQRQLTFLRIIHELVEEENCQFIIATHSPFCLAIQEQPF